MPSNAMKISQLRQQLAAIEAEHGDMDCVLALAADSRLIAIDGRNVNVAITFPWQTLPEPVLTFGLWKAPTGNLSNSPGSLYEIDAVAGEWRTDIAMAPVGVTLDIWRRGKKADTGYRNEEGKWFAYEGGPRAWELAPGAILAWKEQA